MTGTAKRSQAYAARRTAAGERRVSIWYKDATLDALARQAAAKGISRDELINELLDAAAQQ